MSEKESESEKDRNRERAREREWRGRARRVTDSRMGGEGPCELEGEKQRKERVCDMCALITAVCSSH